MTGNSYNKTIILLALAGECRRVVYEFFECSANIPSGLSAKNSQKLVVYCFCIIIQKTRGFSVGL